MAQKKSLKSALDLLFQFSKFSGLQPNITKTKAILIGSAANSRKKICSDLDIQWTVEPLTVHGITYTADLKDLGHLNFDRCLQKIQKEITAWSKRNISPLGKISVIKSLLLPKFTHMFTVIPKPDKFFLRIWKNFSIILFGIIKQKEFQGRQCSSLKKRVV
jgi:hypothetical protein